MPFPANELARNCWCVLIRRQYSRIVLKGEMSLDWATRSTTRIVMICHLSSGVSTCIRGGGIIRSSSRGEHSYNRVEKELEVGYGPPC